MLTGKELLDNARKAYLENRLIAQHHEVEFKARLLSSRDGEFCCALGASLPEKYWETHHHKGALPDTICDQGPICTELWRAHDAWACSARRAVPSEDLKRHEQAFKDLVQC